MTHKDPFKISGNTVQTNIADFCDILLKVKIGITILQMKWLFSLFVDFKYINCSCGFFTQNGSFVIATLLKVIFKIAEKMFHFNIDISIVNFAMYFHTIS